MITIPNEAKRVVAREVKEIIEDVTGDNVSSQNLKKGWVVKGGGNKVIINDDGKDVTVTYRSVNETIKSRITNAYGISGHSSGHDVPEFELDDQEEPEPVDLDTEVPDFESPNVADDDRGNKLSKGDVRGSISFVPAFTKDDADYKPSRDNFTDNNCQDCARYIEGGGCHLVRGEVSPRAVCMRFYSEYGFYGDENGEVNLSITGDEFTWSEEDAQRFVDQVAEELDMEVE